MMKANRHRIVLFILFFGSLLALWGLDLSGVRRTSDEVRRADRLAPDLIDTPEAEIRRLVIDRGNERLVFERRGEGLGRWQMVEPKDVAAEPVRLDALVRNLKELRKDPDAGTIKGDPGSYGLAPPAATVRLYAGPAGSAATDRPVAELELGLSKNSRRYVRPAGGAGFDVVDARLLSAVDQPVDEWRQPNVMAVPTFQVTALRVIRRDESGRPAQRIEARRGASGRWTLMLPVESTADGPKREPLEVPANGPKVESLLGALSSLRVAEAPKGYVADDVKDMARFGLGVDRPSISVELKTEHGGPIVLEIGKPVPDDPERRYVRQGDQDDVVMVEGRALTEIPADATALRSQQIAEILPAAVTEFEIGTTRDVFKLRKDRGGWDLLSPRKERADAQAVHEFLSHIQELQTSEFLEPKVVPNPMLDPPVMTLKIRQATPGRPAAGATDKDAPLALDLRLGNHDVLKKAIYARLEGDSVILALPDKILEVLPKNPLAFRDRTVVTDRPDRIKRLTIRRGGRVDELVPDSKGEPNAWRMLRPVEARADTPTITQVLTVLCGLRAQDFAAPSVAEAKGSGLDRPLMEIDWESDGSHHLKIGAPVPRSASFYATSDGEPMVFTLPAETVRALDAEYHDHRVMSFNPARAGRIVLTFFGRTVALRHRPPQARGQVEWVPEGGSDAGGIDLSRIGSLVQTMSQLQTRRFIQYDGEIPVDTGLSRPRLKVEVTLGGKEPAQFLRIGDNAGDGSVCATTSTGSSGPAFLLPGPPWNELIRSGERLPDLPDDVFASADSSR
jgi:hypothetical protein